MGTVGLVTDSSACLPAQIADRAGIGVVPVTIHLSSRVVPGDDPVAARLVYDALRRDEPVKSSAPTPLEYLQAIDDLEVDSVIVVVPAEEFTVMRRNAMVGAGLARHPVTVVDSRTAASAQGLVVGAAAAAIAAGGSHDDVVEVIEDASRRAELVAMLDQLRYVRRSGRVSAAALGLAEELGIKPVFRLRDGRVERVAIPRSEGAALERIAREAARHGLPQGDGAVVFHASSPARADRLVGRLGVTAPPVEFSPGMGIHTGPGVAGVAWLRRSSSQA
jgi:DegV family protein with EDD domain